MFLRLLLRRSLPTTVAAVAASLISACAVPTSTEIQPSTATRPDAGPDTATSRSQAAAPRFTIDPRLTLYRPLAAGRPAIVAAEAAGVVEHPIHRTLAAQGIANSGPGASTTESIRLLPEDSSDPRRFAVLTAGPVILRTGPIDKPGRRDNLSELTAGEELWLLDRTANDKPTGSDKPTPDDRPTPADLAAGAGSDRDRDDDPPTPPAGRAGRSSRGRQPDTQPTAPVGPAWLVHSSDGYLGWVNESELTFVDAADFAARLRSHTSDAARAKIETVIAHAKSLTGTPYLWGGKTAGGIDCSGLLQTSYGAVGVRLPRDADMQSSIGRLVATRWFRGGLLPGDLLFFLHAKRGHVHHVAMYLGDGKFIEAASKGVAVRSLKPGDADYDAKRDAEFGWARRVVE